MGQSPLPGSEAEAVGSELWTVSSKPLAIKANTNVNEFLLKNLLLPVLLLDIFIQSLLFANVGPDPCGD
jgi:hypothetical protein